MEIEIEREGGRDKTHHPSKRKKRKSTKQNHEKQPSSPRLLEHPILEIHTRRCPKNRCPSVRLGTPTHSYPQPTTRKPAVTPSRALSLSLARLRLVNLVIHKVRTLCVLGS